MIALQAIAPPINKGARDLIAKATRWGLAGGSFEPFNITGRRKSGNAALSHCFGHLPGRPTNITGSINARYIGTHFFICRNIFHLVIKLDPDMGGQFHNAPCTQFDKDTCHRYARIIGQDNFFNAAIPGNFFDLLIF